MHGIPAPVSGALARLRCRFEPRPDATNARRLVAPSKEASERPDSLSPMAEGRHIAVVWRLRSPSRAALGELREAVVARVDEEAEDRSLSTRANQILRELLGTLSPNSGSYVTLTLLWGYGFPVVTISCNRSDSAPSDLPSADQLRAQLEDTVAVPFVRDHRVEMMENNGARVVVVLNVCRRLGREMPPASGRRAGAIRSVRESCPSIPLSPLRLGQGKSSPLGHKNMHG
jgi:hypothetical protein